MGTTEELQNSQEEKPQQVDVSERNDAEKSVEASPSSPSSPSSGAPVNSEDLEPVVTLKTWIVTIILSWGYGLSFWPVPVMSAIGTLLATEFQEPTKYVWFVPAWTITITISFLIFGPNTDLLGRRWFLVLGNLCCTVGHIIIASAKSNEQIIAGMAVSGFGAGPSQMAAFTVPELLPNKWRHIGVVIADMTVYLAVIVGPVTARYGWEFDTWYWNFWGPTIFQFISFLGLLFLYFPPARPTGMPINQVIKELDYLGIVLFIIGAVPVLMGIVWAGIYPSSDAYVVAPLVIGFFFLVCFALWETYGKLKHPLTPTHIFTASWGRDFTAPAVALGVVNMFYYSSSIIWPVMITNFYTNGGLDWRYATILSLPQGFAILGGALGLGFFGSTIKNWQWQLTGSVFIMVLFGSLLGMVTPDNKDLMIAFIFLSQLGFGWALYLSIALTQMGVQHKDLGIAGGISGSFRFAAGSIGTAVYMTVYNNEIAAWTPKLVPKAATAAGLAQDKVTEMMAAIGTPTFAESYSPEVVAAVTAAMNEVYCKGIFIVAMVSLAFGIVGLIACACCKDVESKMTNKIEVYLENTELADRNKFH